MKEFTSSIEVPIYILSALPNSQFSNPSYHYHFFCKGQAILRHAT